MPESPTDIVIACCRDESDLIVPFIDFYLEQGFDKVCLIDNGSRDGTLDQVLRHPARHRVLVLSDPRPGYDKRLLEYHAIFAPQATRWVFFLDVDELVVLPGGIKGFAAELPPEVTILRLPTAEMLPEPGAGPHRSPLLSTRREARFQTEGKLVWKRIDVRKIYCGKHEIEAAPDVRHSDPRVYIRHYHTRGERQFRAKLENRIETEMAFAPGEAEELTVFSPEQRRQWVERSRRLLSADGWEIEQQRLAAVPWTRETAVRDWFEEREKRGERLQVSPAISVAGNGFDWQCFCIRDLQPGEGHTADQHLAMVLVPERPFTGLDGTLFAGCEDVPVRIHSECLLGDVFRSDRCDCGLQLAAAMRRIEEAGHGVVLYLRQEGRGIGLFDKLRSLTVAHPDSFVRNELLGLPADARSYRLAARVARGLGLSSVRLLSGNPMKAACLEEAGILCVSDLRVDPESLSVEAYEEYRTKLQRGYTYDFFPAAACPAASAAGTAGAAGSVGSLGSLGSNLDDEAGLR
jgi:GTP cyclohydrolase II